MVMRITLKQRMSVKGTVPQTLQKKVCTSTTHFFLNKREYFIHMRKKKPGRFGWCSDQLFVPLRIHVDDFL